MERYQSYKDSGVEWLGSIPESWRVVRNKEIFKERSSLSATGKETLLTVSHITGVTRRSEKNVNMFMAETMAGYKICHEGDLVVNTMWAWMGALGTSQEAGICSPAYGVYMPLKGTPYNYKYFDYLLRTPNAIVEMTRNSKGIVSSRLRLYAKEFFQIQVALPSQKEQAAIAHYLDTKTAQIDRKIDLLTRKAVLYGNLKQSLINETVTRGLDKSVPMKNSEIEWIGGIPKHWETRRLKDMIATLESGTSVNATNIPAQEHERGILKTSCVYRQSFFPTENKTILREEVHRAKCSPRKGNIIISGMNTPALVGASGFVDRDYPTLFLPDRLWQTVFVRNIDSSAKWLSYVLATTRLNEIISFSATGSSPSMKSIAQEDFLRIEILLPPLSEQIEIFNYLDTKIVKISKAVKIINTKLENLKNSAKPSSTMPSLAKQR